MTRPGKLCCVLLVFCLTSVSAYAVAPTKSRTGQGEAKAKTAAKGKATTTGKVDAKTKTNKQNRSQRASFQFDAADEKAFDAEVAAARRILAAKPDVAARITLAHAAVVLVDRLLRAEAIGDREKVQHLAGKLSSELHDTGWRVLTMSQQPGNLMARQAAGYLLEGGVLMKKDSAKSCSEFVAAAEKLAPAGWRAAQCLMQDSPDDAWAQMERAAQRGHAAALEWMGRRCLGEFGGSQKDLACARNYFLQSASLGRPSAQTLLAFLLVTGQGGPADLARAVRLYKTAAEKGDINAQNNLGEVYETGRGVAIDLEEAVRWYESAAEKGLGSAQFNAGRLWAIGIGGKQDPTKARSLLMQAETNGISQAKKVLEWLDQRPALAADGASGLKPATELDGNRLKE